MKSHSFLDELIEEDSIQLLKTALPYLSASGQSFASVFVKFLEFQNTLRLVQASKGGLQLCAQSVEQGNPLEMLTACSDVCHGEIKEKIDHLINTILMLQMFELSQNSKERSPSSS